MANLITLETYMDIPIKCPHLLSVSNWVRLFDSFSLNEYKHVLSSLRIYEECKIDKVSYMSRNFDTYGPYYTQFQMEFFTPWSPPEATNKGFPGASGIGEAIVINEDNVRYGIKGMNRT